MTESVPLQVAAERLPDLVRRAADGEDVVLTDSGRPVARLVGVAGRSAPVQHPVRTRPLGLYRGRVWIAEDADETPDWLVDAFYGIDADLPPPAADDRTDPGRKERGGR